ncbi:hypothetical protein T5B8_12693 [Salinisphaera sp. T5B8]|uniref:hypothetical protein n=1 Tax=Salinisphaera sp. T5B8 TaxID=1304154 RepID=UPI00333E56A1
MTAREPVADVSQRTGAVFFVRVTCRDLTQLIITDSTTLYRLRTEGGVFFFDAKQFDVDTLARKLRRGEQVTVGAHRLRDGNAWLHWVKTADGQVWAGEPTRRRWLAPLVLALSWLPIALALVLPGAVNIGWVLLRIALFCVAAAAFGWSLYRVLMTLHPGRRRLRRALAAMKRGQQPTLSAPPSYEAPPELARPDGVYGDIGVIQDRLRKVRVALKTYGSGRAQYSVHEYQLDCGGATFGLQTQAGDWRRALDPILARRSPLFLAQGDRVALLTSMADGEIRGVLNHSDGSAHVAFKGTPYTSMARWLVLVLVGLISAFMSVILLGISFYDWYERGVGPDYWDWLEVARMLGAVGLMLLLFFSAIGLIAERIHYFYFRARARVPLEKILGLAFQWRLRQQRSAIINELA